jgi:hypothetical protein
LKAACYSYRNIVSHSWPVAGVGESLVVEEGVKLLDEIHQALAEF